MIKHGIYLQGFVRGAKLPITLELLGCAILLRREKKISRDELRDILSIPSFLIRKSNKCDDFVLSASILRGLRRFPKFKENDKKFSLLLKVFKTQKKIIEEIVWAMNFDLVPKSYPDSMFVHPSEKVLSPKGVFLKGFADGKGHKRLAKALFFAIRAHEGETRRSGEPFSEHAIRTCLNLVNNGERDEDTLIAALLHDVVENERVTIEEVREKFGEEVAFLVGLVTKRLGEKLEIYYARVSSDLRAVKVKVADRTDNARDWFRVFSLQKKKEQIEETKHYVLPMMKDARRRDLEASEMLIAFRDRIVEMLEHLEEIVRKQEREIALERMSFWERLKFLFTRKLPACK